MPILVYSLGEALDREACIRWLARDPIQNLMLLGDLYPPLIDVSDVYVAIEEGDIVGVGSLFRGFPTPSVIITESNLVVQNTLLSRMSGDLETEWMTVSNSASSSIFRKFGNLIHSHTERQMLLRKPITAREKPARLIQREEFDSLDQFYVEHQAEAWTPPMFEMGPYYGVWCNDQLISAAGTHFVTPFIAQIGNVFTHPKFRGRGYATAATIAVTNHLRRMGIKIISLFVVDQNEPAIRIYERLGFVKERELIFAHYASTGSLYHDTYRAVGSNQ
ncbi:MAG: GNAT family N-acetyltransferase [Candidatus Poribacteria bacterium]|nr:GNAT family N-acetyltransferase [Candidatus Poribacteria bacterium]MDE0505529.1 GNAT family N-acetyltransferase [Candidatus Poribacteria bacterium]